MTADHHPLVRAMYDPGEDGGYRGRRDARDIEFLMLPLPLRQLLVRASRLARLTEMNAPHAILEQERRMVAESTLAFNGYLTARVLEPARRACDAQRDEQTRTALRAHLAGRHGADVDETVTANLLVELHLGLHDGAELDHEDYDYDEGGET